MFIVNIDGGTVEIHMGNFHKCFVSDGKYNFFMYVMFLGLKWWIFDCESCGLIGNFPTICHDSDVCRLWANGM